jgi:hypothetical protein
MRQLLLLLAIIALVFGQATNFCLSSLGAHTPTTTIPQGGEMKAGYRYAYSTVHEASDVTVESGVYTVTFSCNGVNYEVSATIPAATTSWDRTSDSPDLSDPASWQPPVSETDCSSQGPSFQSNPLTAPSPTGCSGDLTVVSQRICLSVTGTNNIDTVLFEWHSDSGTDYCAPFSDGKLITPAPDCGTDWSVITDLECSVACLCWGFQMINNVYNSDGTNTFTFKVWNMCDTGMSYIAFGTAGLTLISPTSSYRSPVTGINYQVYWMSTSGNPGFTSIKFQGGGAAIQNGGSDEFTFTVGGWYPGYVWTIQGHRGGQYETFASVDLSSCCPTPASCPTTVVCDPGVGTSGDPPVCDETVCADTAPNGYQWICRWNGVSDWYLDAVPEGQFPAVTNPATWFDPVTSGANAPPGEDPMGYQVGCDCKRVIFTCPDNCCGLGNCNEATGVCECTIGTGDNCCTYQPPTSTILLTLTGSGTGATGSSGTTGGNVPCFNDGVFCSGNGICDVANDVCTCDAGFSGVSCEVEAVPPSCFDYTGTDAEACTDCLTAPPELSCVWCAGVAGEQCLPFDSCSNPQFACDEGVVPTTPGECETDADCNDKGQCVTSAEGNYCQCDDGERGQDCSSGGLSNLGKALAISGGIVAVIVIGGVVALVLLGFGAKKGFDYLTLKEINMGNSHQNPFYRGNEEHTAPTYAAPGTN